MKKSVTVVAAIVLFFMFLIPVLANDADDLRKLQPLSSPEQSKFEKVKNDTHELHKFIATRTYLRLIKPMVEGTDPKKIDGCKLPKMPDNVSAAYVVSDREFDIIWRIMMDQTGECKDNQVSPGEAGQIYVNDADDLRKLQPLSSSEQSMYEKVKNNTPELHKFIATRTYLRLIKPMIGARDPWKIDSGELRKLPAMNKAVKLDYVVDDTESAILWAILLAQT
ncbi:MAG: hypothetical protein ABSC11_10080 [Smithella sp.]|jgi:hypothetical protein